MSDRDGQRRALELLGTAFRDEPIGEILARDFEATSSHQAGMEQLTGTLTGAVDLTTLLVLELRDATGQTVPQILTRLGEIVNRDH